MARIAQVGLGQWGKNLVRNFADLADLAWLCDVDDVRESPAEKIIQLLQKAGADVAYHDPHVAEFDGMRSVDYQPEDYDGVVIVTAHRAIDYDDLVERAQIVVDFRNATGRNGTGNGKVWKL